MRNRLWTLVMAVLGAAVVAGCSEDLNSSAACPVLCPGQNFPVREVVIDPVLFDSTVGTFPLFGTEPTLLLAARGDTLDTRVFVRFDSLVTKFQRTASDTFQRITELRSASVKLLVDSTARLPGDTAALVTIEAFDVDAPGVDTSAAGLLPLFENPGRRLGALTLKAGALRDSVRIPLDSAALLAKITDTTSLRLRLGFRIVADGPAQVRIAGDGASILSYRPSLDTNVALVHIGARSRSPKDNPQVAFELSDFQLVARGGTTALDATTLAVGGLPARRTYMRFALPDSIDGRSVIRATLFLTQRPNRTSVDAGTGVQVAAHRISAGAAVTDLRRASLLTVPFELDSIRPITMAPADSGVRAFEMASVVARFWPLTSPDDVPRAIILRLADEALRGSEIFFFSHQADPAVRPRLRLTYIPGATTGLP